MPKGTAGTRFRRLAQKSISCGLEFGTSPRDGLNLGLGPVIFGLIPRPEPNYFVENKACGLGLLLRWGNGRF